MTFQACNRIYLDGKEAGFAAVKGERFYIPKDVGIKTRPASTACYRGYIIQYEIKNNELFLREFLFRAAEDPILPEINGVKPIKYNKTNPHPLMGLGFNHEYKDINLKIPFTGTLWLYRDPKSASYVPIEPSNFEFFGIRIPPTFYDVKFKFQEGTIINTEEKKGKSFVSEQSRNDEDGEVKEVSFDEIHNEMQGELDRLRKL